MANEDLVLILLTIAFVSIFPLVVIVFVLARRFAKRHHVWLEIKTPKETIVKLVKPNKDGRTITYAGARYYMHPDALDLYKGGWLIKDYKPRFRYILGQPFPYKYGTKKVVVDIPGMSPHTAYEYFDEPKVIPGKTLEVFMKSKVWAEIYQRHDALTFMLLIGVVLLVVLVIGLYSIGGH